MFDLIESQFRHNTEDLLLNSLVLRKKASSFEVCTIILQIMFRVCMAPKEKYPFWSCFFFAESLKNNTTFTGRLSGAHNRERPSFTYWISHKVV